MRLRLYEYYLGDKKVLEQTWNASDAMLDMNSLGRITLAPFSQITLERGCAVLMGVDLYIMGNSERQQTKSNQNNLTVCPS